MLNKAKSHPQKGQKTGVSRGRKATDTNAQALAHCLPQEAVWRFVRELKVFDAADIETAARKHFGGGGTGLNGYTVRSYLNRLNKGGYLTKETVVINGSHKQVTWTLVKDCGVEAPRLNKDGTPSKHGQVRDQLWRTLKIIGDFNYVELAAAATLETSPVSPNTSRTYIKQLYKAGYLFLTRPHKPGTPARYRTVPRRCEGPKAPMVLRTKEVFDPNLMKVVSPDNH